MGVCIVTGSLEIHSIFATETSKNHNSVVAFLFSC